MARYATLMSNWEDDALTPREVACVLHVSLSTIYRMIKVGILDTSEVTHGSGSSRGYRIPRSEIDHYIESLKTTARRRTGVASRV